MKRFFALLLTLTLICGLAACGAKTSTDTAASGSVEAGLLRVAALYDITTMDVAQTTDNYMVPMNVFDRLFEVDENFNVTSRILSDWYYSKNEDSAGVWVRVGG